MNSQHQKHFLALGLLLTPASMFALTWTTNNPMPGVGKRNNSVVSTGQYVFSLGGRADDDGETAAGNDVYQGVMGNDGLITWTIGNSLPGKRTEGGAAITGGRIYYYGGWEVGFPTVGTCYYAPLTGGVIGSWVTSAVTMPVDGADQLADSFGRNNLVFNNTLYQVNGENNSANHSETAHYSRLTIAGDYGPWTSMPEPGDISTWWHGMAAYAGTTANYLYRLGGAAAFNDYTSANSNVYRAVINPDGSTGAWTLLTNQIPGTDGLSDFACIQFENKIYVCGGVSGTYAVSNAVHVGTINPADGDITWTTDPDPMPEARARVSGNVVTAPNGTVYLAIVGGAPATGPAPGGTTVFTASLGVSSVEAWELY